MSAHAAVRPFNASRPRPRPISPSRMHEHAHFYLKMHGSYLGSGPKCLKSLFSIENGPKDTCQINNIHMLQIDFGLYRPCKPVLSRCCAPRAQLLSPILRHLRCHMSIGGGLHTYDTYAILTYGSNVSAWGPRPVSAQVCRGLPTETVRWHQRPVSNPSTQGFELF